MVLACSVRFFFRALCCSPEYIVLVFTAVTAVWDDRLLRSSRISESACVRACVCVCVTACVFLSTFLQNLLGVYSDSMSRAGKRGAHCPREAGDPAGLPGRGVPSENGRL